VFPHEGQESMFHQLLMGKLLDVHHVAMGGFLKEIRPFWKYGACFVFAIVTSGEEKGPVCDLKNPQGYLFLCHMIRMISNSNNTS